MAKKSEPKPEDRRAVGHHSGERIWGYEVFQDGSICLSPGFCERMNSRIATDEGLRQLLRETNKYVADELARGIKQRTEWWGDVAKDIGINVHEAWTYDPFSQTIKIAPPEPDKPKSES